MLCFPAAAATAQEGSPFSPTLPPDIIGPVQALPTRTPSPTVSPTVATPTPLPLPTSGPPVTLEGVVASVLAVPIFPVGIRFDIRIDAPPEEITRLDLTLRYPGMRGPAQRIVLEQFEQLSDGQYIGFFASPPDNPPGIYALVEFEVEVDAGNRPGEASGAVTFDDRRTAWVHYSLQDDRLGVTSAGRGRLTLAREIEAMYVLLARVAEPPARVNVMIYEETAPPGCPDLVESGDPNDAVAIRINRLLRSLYDACTPEMTAASYEAGGYLPFVNRPNVGTDIARALTGAFLGEAWAAAEAPDWLAEGFARLVAPQPMARAQVTSQDAERAGRTFTLAAMQTRPVQDDARLLQWDAQAYGMMLYVLDRAGLDGVVELARRAAAEPFDEAFERVTGEPLSALVARWGRWLFDARTTSIYGITPYLPPTPTPAPTLTASLTYTPSQTFTPQPPTELPSATPTRAPATATSTSPPEPPTLTVTPRSASALVTPTAAPESQPGAGTGILENRATILLGILAVLALLAAAVLLAGRRR
jgi:hypothetical protein